MKGRKPQATALKLIKNNPGRRPINKDEPKPAAPKKAPQAPRYLSDGAKAIWRELAREMHRLGMLTRLDYGTLAAYCEAEATFRAANTEIQSAAGIIIPVGGKEKTVKKKNGDVETTRSRASYTTHPLLWVRNQAMQQMYKFGSVLGLNPSERSRIKAEPPTDPKGGTWDEF